MFVIGQCQPGLCSLTRTSRSSLVTLAYESVGVMRDTFARQEALAVQMIGSRVRSIIPRASRTTFIYTSLAPAIFPLSLHTVYGLSRNLSSWTTLPAIRCLFLRPPPSPTQQRSGSRNALSSLNSIATKTNHLAMSDLFLHNNHFDRRKYPSRNHSPSSSIDNLQGGKAQETHQEM